MEPINFGRDSISSSSKNDLLSTLSVRSRDGIVSTDSASNFTVRLTYPIHIRTMELSLAAITINNFTLQDTMYLVETGFPEIPFTLPPAIYNDSNIAAALQAALNAASLAGNVYTVTIDTTNLTLTVTAVGVTWRFGRVTNDNASYYGLGVATSRVPPVATPALSFTFGAYDFRPYDIIYIDVQGFPTSNVTSGSNQFTFTLTCASVNSGGIAIYTSESFAHQYWVNTTFATFGKMQFIIRDTYGREIPLRGGSTTLLLTFNRLTSVAY